MNRSTSLLPYFGGKSKIAHLYPSPGCKRIVEPFAGGASYSLRYADHDVWLNDLNPDTASIWKFLTSRDALRFVTRRVPFTMEHGDTLETVTRPDDPPGFKALLRSQLAQGSFGMRGTRKKVSPFGAQAWKTFRQRLTFWIPRIAHWKITSVDYRKLPNETATWFIDPPYNNAAGRTYAKGASAIDFTRLAKWCQSRKGQVIVCENVGADWLPFRRLTTDEAVFVTDDGTVGLWDAASEGHLSKATRTRIKRAQESVRRFQYDGEPLKTYPDAFFYHLRFLKRYPKAVSQLLKDVEHPEALRELIERL